MRLLGWAFAIEAVDVDVDAGALLEYLKNEYIRKKSSTFDNYIDNSVVFSSAEESVQELHQIVLDIEDKVDLEVPQESMQRIELFEPEEEIGKYRSWSQRRVRSRIKFLPRFGLVGVVEAW